MRVCFFGTFEMGEGYPVNRVLLKGLSTVGVDVLVCREEIWSGFLHILFQRGVWGGYLRLAWRMLSRYPRLVWRYSFLGGHEVVIVGYFGYLDVMIARLLNWRSRRPVVLVAFISLFDTVVLDRGQLAKGSWKARLLKAADRLAYRCADVVLTDTQAQGEHYARLFSLSPGKFRRSFVGEDDEIFDAAPPRVFKTGIFRTLFFGTYVPLHGIEVILAAMAEFSEEGLMHFTLIGNGQLYPEMRRLAEDRCLSNARFVDHWLGPEELLGEIRSANVCLGVFGTTGKAARVIPYKVFDALSQGRPVITRDSPAARELLVDGETALLCDPSGPSLARALRRLRDDPALAQRLGEQGYQCFCRHGAPTAVGSSLRQILEIELGD